VNKTCLTGHQCLNLWLANLIWNCFIISNDRLWRFILLLCPHRRAANCVNYFFSMDTIFMPFDLQLKINSESTIIPSDFYYVKSYICFPFDDSQHVIFMNDNGNKFYASTAGKTKTKINLNSLILFHTFVSSTGSYLIFCSTRILLLYMK
jgi:hypothetical protein